ncbi:MAG: hypothetical protein QOE45_3122 [Frankiaceae bacterium]|jgi:hypothetical protein|nr:hypothetical protein [Frankiaceae bacterium]
MSVFRRARNVLGVALLAAGLVTAAAGTASAQDLSQSIPQSPYCFTVDGSGVCIILTLHVDQGPDLLAGDATASLTGQIGFYCPGLNSALCNAVGSLGPISVGRSGAVAGNPTVGITHIADVRVPQVCVPGGCFGPYFVPVDAPTVNGPIAELWVNGRQPLNDIVITCQLCH